MRKGSLFIFSGPSGIGKDTVLKEVMNSSDNIRLSISSITREMRDGEIEGEKYHFVSREEFEEMINKKELLEYNEYIGNFYGTPKAPVVDWMNKGYDVILEIDVNGAFKVKKKMPEAVMVFMLPKSIDVLRHRLEKRGTESPETIEKRLRQAAREITFAPEYDYVFFNDDLETAVNDLKSIIRANALLNENMKENYGKVIDDAKSIDW
ncbi:MAG: guanylate kinase [Acutalibacteraceae bacterium]|nr:guanylate kinase [Acutalibacteraceae bacterium]